VEEVNEQLKPQSEQGTESNQEQIVQNEPLARVNSQFKFDIEQHLIDDETSYREASEEEKIAHCAAQITLQVLNKILKVDKFGRCLGCGIKDYHQDVNGKTCPFRYNKILTSEEQSLLFDRTVRQVRSERANMFQQLDEAEKELAQLKWNNILPQSLTQQNNTRAGNRYFRTQRSAGGFRGLYIITFGNFVLAKQGNWIYRPTNDQMMKLANRFTKQKACENQATSFRLAYRSSSIDGKEVENEEFIKFKKDLLDQINELRATV